MSSKKSQGKSNNQNFEGLLKRLEEIVETLENGSISLDDVMNMYEEGVKLSKQCLGQLSEAEIKLKRLSKDVNGDFKLYDNIEK